MPSFTSRLGAACVLAAATACAQADPLTINGTAASTTDVVRIPLFIDASGLPLSIWTDSYQSGKNFDPVIALWDAQGMLVAYNDTITKDWRAVLPGVTFGDAGIRLDNVAAGAYTLTVVNWRIEPVGKYAPGSSLDQGWSVLAVKDYAPAGCGLCGQQGWWEVRIDSGAPVSAVPEPASTAMLAAGLALALLWRRRGRA